MTVERSSHTSRSDMGLVVILYVEREQYERVVLRVAACRHVDRIAHDSTLQLVRIYPLYKETTL